MFSFCVNGGRAKTKKENCCTYLYIYIYFYVFFVQGTLCKSFLLRRSFSHLVSFSGTVSIYVSGVSLCQDKYTNASDAVVTREQRMQEQAWDSFGAVSAVMLYVSAG